MTRDKRMLFWHLVTFATLLFVSFAAKGAETRLEALPGGNINHMYLQTADGHVVPAVVGYTSDGNGNIIPIGSGGGGTSNVNVLNFPAIQAVSQSGSWAVTANQGTSPWVVGGTVAATQSGTWTTGRTWNLSSASDSVTAVISGTVPISGTITANQGTSPWVVSGTVAATQSGTWTVQQGTPPWSVSQSGAWTVTANQGTSPWVVSGTVAATQSGTWTTGRTWTLSSGTDSVSAAISNFPATTAVTQSTSPWVDNISQFGGSNVVTGTGASGAGIPRVTVSNDSNILATQSGTWNINNISGTISLPTGAATSALQSTMITNQTNGTQKTQVTAIPSDSLPATQNVTVQDTASTTTAFANAQNFITGTPTANSAASFALSTFDSVEVQVTGTWTGTLQTEISMDGGTTWFTRGIKQSGSAYVASSFTANFEGGMNFAGMTNVRVRAVAAVTGTATVRITASVNPGSITVSNPLTLRDSTVQSVMNTIKAASTAVATTDTALVVGISPNTGMPAEAGHAVLSTFTQTYSSSNLATGAFTTLITSVGTTINQIDIFDTSGGDYYIAYAATCGALSTATNAIIVSAGGGGKNFQVPSGNCLGFEAKTALINTGSVNMTFYK